MSWSFGADLGSVFGSVLGLVNKGNPIKALARNAMAAGIHPLAALGAAANYSPAMQAGDSPSVTASKSKREKDPLQGAALAKLQAETALLEAQTRTALKELAEPAAAVNYGDPDGSKDHPFPLFRYFRDEHGNVFKQYDSNFMADPEEIVGALGTASATKKSLPRPGRKPPPWRIRKILRMHEAIRRIEERESKGAPDVLF